MANIVTNGHIPLLAHVAIDMASTEKWQKKARDAGADGMLLLWNIPA